MLGRVVVAGEERRDLARLVQQREPVLYLAPVPLLAQVLHRQHRHHRCPTLHHCLGLHHHPQRARRAPHVRRARQRVLRARFQQVLRERRDSV